MKVINVPPKGNINEEVEYPNTSRVKIVIKEAPKNFVIKHEELEEEMRCCFVLGYN